MTEQQKYLDFMCSRINNHRPVIMAVAHLDDYVKLFLESERAQWIRKSRIAGRVYIPRFDYEYDIIPVSEGFRGYKPAKVIIDSRLSIEVLQTIVEPCLILCNQCNYF